MVMPSHARVRVGVTSQDTGLPIVHHYGGVRPSQAHLRMKYKTWGHSQDHLYVSTPGFMTQTLQDMVERGDDLVFTGINTRAVEPFLEFVSL